MNDIDGAQQPAFCNAVKQIGDIARWHAPATMAAMRGMIREEHRVDRNTVETELLQTRNNGRIADIAACDAGLNR